MKRIVFILNFIFAATTVIAQVPAGFSYQAVVRNSSGEIIANKTVKFQFSILRDSESGIPVYVETHSVPTNSFGLANLIIGEGTKVSGDFDISSWGDNTHFLKIEINPDNGTTFSHLGTTQLLAVPYAFHAQTVEDDSWGTQTTVTNETLDGNGITSSPLKIARQGATNGQVLKWNGTTWQPDTDDIGEAFSLPYHGSYSFIDDDVFKITNPDNGNAIVGISAHIGIHGQTSGTHLSDIGVRGYSSNNSGTGIGVAGDASSENGYSGYFYRGRFFIGGNTGIGVSEPTAKLDIDGQLKIRGGCPAEGKVLTSDASGLAYWQNPSGGGLTLPYSGSGELASDPIFTITNTGNGSGIKGRSDATSGVYYGVIGESASQNGTGVYGSAPHIGVEAHAHASDGTAVWGYAYDSEGQNYGIRGITNSSTGYSGYFHGGRFYISGNTGIGVTNPAAKLDIDGQLKVRGGSPGEGKVLTSDATGLASWLTPSGGGFTLPYSGTASSDGYIFKINNSGSGNGIEGYTIAGTAISGVANAPNSANIGVSGQSSSSSGVGVWGNNISTSAGGIGIRGSANSSGGYSGYFTDGKFYVSGNVGINTGNPVNALSVSGQADISGGLVVGGTTLAGRLLVANADGAGNSFKVGSSAGDNANIYFLTDGLIFDCYRVSDARRQPILLQPNGGRVGIGTKTPSQALDVNGNARFSSIGSAGYYGPVNRTSDGTLTTSTSDIRLKENIETLETCLEKVLQLRGVSFTWKSDPEMGTRIGFIAQEFEKIIPELVFTNPVDGYKGINYAEASAFIVEAVKEQQRIIEDLKNENERLKAENSQVMSRLDKLEYLMSVYAEKK